MKYKVTANVISFLCLYFMFTFTDVNECDEALSVCGHHSHCFNTNGSFYCQCEPGFLNRGGVNFTAISGQCQGEYVVCLCVCMNVYNQ